MPTFSDCIAHVLAAEGGLVNDPKDPGGLTKFGISQRSYPALDIRALYQDDSKAIYLPSPTCSPLPGPWLDLHQLAD